MNILLIRPRPHKDTINLQSFMICEPLELETVSAALEQRGHKTTIADMLCEKRSLKAFLRGVDMVCFTSYLVHAGIVKKYAEIVKNFNKNIITVAGGVHAEVMPSDFADANIDYIISRAPLETVVSIADNGGLTDELRDCVYGKSVKLRDILTDTDPPFPDREKTAKYRKHYNYVLHSRCATIKMSFGCQHSCDFCFCREITGGKYSCRNMNTAVEEMKSIKEKNVFIVDDNFLSSVARADEFCALLKENNVDKHFILFSRTDFISQNEATIEKLSKCGLKAVFMGIESFKKEELDSLNKRTTAQMNVAAVRILEKYEVESYMGLICQNDWAREDFDALIEYLNGFKYPFINLQPLMPVPGTALYEKEKDKIALPREKYHLWDMAHLVYQPEKISVREYYKNILRVYLKTSASPRMRKYIRKKYGIKVYLRALKGAASIALQYYRLSRKNKVDV